MFVNPNTCLFPGKAIFRDEQPGCREFPKMIRRGKSIFRDEQPLSLNEKHPPRFPLVLRCFSESDTPRFLSGAVEKLFFFDFGFDFPRNDDILYTILDVGY